MLHSKTSKVLCLMLTIFMVVLVGCASSSSKSLTFAVTTTDKPAEQVKVTLDTSKGHTMNAADGGVVIKDKDATFSMEGVFIGEPTYNDYVDVINNPSDYDNIETTGTRSTSKGQTYQYIIFKTQTNDDALFLFMNVPNIDDVYVLYSCEKTSSPESVLAAFDMLYFTKG